MRTTIAIGAAALLALTTTAARAEPWTDYTPQKGAYRYTLVKVEPNRMDDYMLALKKTWVPGEEEMKRRGMIDGYWVQQAGNAYGSGPNVVLVEHYPSLAAMEPDRARDIEMMRMGEKVVPKDQVPMMAAERGKYRTIMSEELWYGVDLGK